jgi:DNA replication protein DnaC
MYSTRIPQILEDFDTQDFDPRVFDRSYAQWKQREDADFADEGWRREFFSESWREFQRRTRWWSAFKWSRGSRYECATLQNFSPKGVNAADVLAKLQRYIDDLPHELQLGNGVLLFGPTGTGKDHLLSAIAREAILKYGEEVCHYSGLELFGELRSAIPEDRDEGLIVKLQRADVLYLSDPSAAGIELTQFQLASLFRVIDKRYSHRRPMWLSMNVVDGYEAEARFGVPIVDRLRETCLTLHCNWPSWRQNCPLPPAESEDE